MSPARSAKRFVNRELSWLEFNQRVLEQACSESVPLLERLKFLAITASNLDEFFMVRVGGLRLLEAADAGKRDASGMTPRQQLDAIAKRTHRMVADQYACFLNDLEANLAAEGVRRLHPGVFSPEQKSHVEYVFENELFPVLSPLALRGGNAHRPLLMKGRELYLAVRMKPVAASAEPYRVAAIPLGPNINRFIPLPSADGYSFVLVEDAVALFAERFFPGEQVMETAPFRVTRNADLSVREDRAFDLLTEMEQVLDARKRSGCVRLEIADDATRILTSFLQRLLSAPSDGVYRAPGPLDLSACMSLASLEGYDRLRYDSWPPCDSAGLRASESVLEVLSRRDIFLCHPYDSFEPVLRFIQEAAADPNVLAIKQVLYRTSPDSPVVAALMSAARSGKYITVIVELKARFDEARNIEWARALEDAGVNVIYGIRGLKTHAKICIVIRRESGGLRRYMHFGTGNYNEKTARLYTDISYLTSHEDLGNDAAAFLHTVTGYSQPQPFRLIEAAPIGLRERILELLETEIECKRQGHQARVLAKMNSLVDPAIIEALYKASRAGVEILLNVRGICCLRPGIKGLSENIRVVSIVDRFLEHSRAFFFQQGGSERAFISSADWMPRNLDKRVELMVPLEDAASRSRLKELLSTCMADNTNAWEILPDGSHRRLHSSRGRKAVRAQETLYDLARRDAAQARRRRRSVFEPHRPPEP